MICLLYKAIIENDDEIIKEDLIDFNFAIKNKQVNSILVDDGDNNVTIELNTGKIYIQDSVNDGYIDLELSEEQLTSLKDFGFKPVLFRRVSIVKGSDDVQLDRKEKLFFGWSCNPNDSIVYRMVSLDDGEFRLHLTK